jgi:hypothetical protein
VSLGDDNSSDDEILDDVERGYLDISVCIGGASARSKQIERDQLNISGFLPGDEETLSHHRHKAWAYSPEIFLGENKQFLPLVMFPYGQPKTFAIPSRLLEVHACHSSQERSKRSQLYVKDVQL